MAKAGAEKPLHPLCLAYITALEKVIDSCVVWFDKVNSHYSATALTEHSFSAFVGHQEEHRLQM